MTAIQANEPVSVRCFENYMDAYMRVGKFGIIIENKVKGAKDQETQIDRYVKTAFQEISGRNNIFVLYITQKGGEPSANSYSETRNIIRERFLALNYQNDILPWLYETLAKIIEYEMKDSDKDLLKCGITQYAHYIEGPDLLDVRTQHDGYEDFRKKVLQKYGSLSIDKRMDFCAELDLCILKGRQSITEQEFNTIALEEKRRFLKDIFYRAFNRVVSDDVFYIRISVPKTDDMIASVGIWEDTQESVVQVDVWCDSTGENNQSYQNA